MWNNTSVSRLLGIKYPIIQGPFGGRFSSTKLVSTVSNLGGMGSFGLNSYGPGEILEVNEEIQLLTDRPYALNLWVPLEDDSVTKFDQAEFEKLQMLFEPCFNELGLIMPSSVKAKTHVFEDQVEAVLEASPPVASFIFGIPSPDIIRALKARNIIIGAVATTLEEAIAIESSGIDFVIASGMQAGGHRASFIKTAKASLEPTARLVIKVTKRLNIPVIAAGGISNGKDIVEMMKLGAGAAQLGTAFLATAESNASEQHKSKLLSPTSFETSLTTIFTGRLARTITTDFIQEFGQYEAVAPYPIQSTFLSPLRKEAKRQNRLDFEAFWAGQPSAILQHRDAKRLFQSLLEEVEESLKEM